MQEREMLELIAKAAGLTKSVIDCGWNPLASDGDALRLAVKLNMQITDRVWCPDGSYSLGSENGISVKFEGYEADPYAATRRAIVRAAAEIGRSMK